MLFSLKELNEQHTTNLSIGINCVLLFSKHKRSVNIAQDKRFSDIFAMISMLLTFKSFLVFCRRTRVSYYFGHLSTSFS